MGMLVLIWLLCPLKLLFNVNHTIDVKTLNSMVVTNEHFQTALGQSNPSTLHEAVEKITTASKGGFGDVATTIAGGETNIASYRDGPSEDAQFSADFDAVYIRPYSSLLVIDRGNAALRQITLNQEDCDFNRSSISIS